MLQKKFVGIGKIRQRCLLILLHILSAKREHRSGLLISLNRVRKRVHSMLKVRKFATALVLGLIMCLALFGTGAFAQIGTGVGISNSVASAGGFGFPFFGGFGGFGGFFGDDFGLGSFFGPDAFASSTAVGLGSGFGGGFGF